MRWIWLRKNMKEPSGVMIWNPRTRSVLYFNKSRLSVKECIPSNPWVLGSCSQQSKTNTSRCILKAYNSPHAMFNPRWQASSMQWCVLPILKTPSVNSRKEQRCRHSKGDYSRFLTWGRCRHRSRKRALVGADWNYKQIDLTGIWMNG